MIVVIDTNVALAMFKPSHRNHLIFRAWSMGRFAWAVTTDILLEYEEIMTRLGSAAYAAQAMRTVAFGSRISRGPPQFGQLSAVAFAAVWRSGTRRTTR